MRTWLAIGVALVVGLALGVVIDSDGRERTSPFEEDVHARSEPLATPAAPVSPERSPELARIDELALEVRTLRSELFQLLEERSAREAPAQAPSGESAREAVAPAAGEGLRDPELRAWMERIDERIERLAKSPGSLPVIRLPPAGLRPRPLPVPLPEDDTDAFATSHLLWTYQDVIDAYGRPDGGPDPGAGEYKYKGEVAPDSELGDVHFQFSSGLVIGMYAH